MAEPYTTPIPGAPGYEQAALLAKRAYQQALAQINSRRSSTLRSYGYQADIDPTTGTPTNMRVDANNPYGQYQMQRRSNARQGEQLEDVYAERGISGGLAAQGQEDLQFDWGRDRAALGQNLIGGLGDLQSQQNESKYAYDAALYQAQLDAARSAIDNQDYNPADYSGVDYPEYGEDPIAQNEPTRNPSTGRVIPKKKAVKTPFKKPAAKKKPQPKFYKRPLTKAEKRGTKATQGRRAVV